VGDVVRFADHATLRQQFAQQISEFQPHATVQDFVSEEQEQAE
jgi:hypothetical protein